MAEPSYVILTESSCDLTAELAAAADVEVVPLTFTMEGRTYPHYPDGRAMPLDEFYRKMRAGVVSTTAAANTAELTEAMERHLEAGRDVLFLCFSSGLSSTRDACALAAAELRERYPQRTVETVDTLAASAGQGLLVLLAGRKRLAGASLEEVRAFAEETKWKTAHWFTVEDLKYLKRGGRISPAVAAVGSMLQIKPVLHVDDEGHLIPVDKVRGRKASLQALVRHMEETALPDQDTVLIAQADCAEEAEALAEQIRQRFAPRETLVVPMGPVIGTHTGPGLMALFFLGTHR